MQHRSWRDGLGLSGNKVVFLFIVLLGIIEPLNASQKSWD